MNFEEIAYKLEKGDRLDNPVLFETPEKLKVLGEKMYLVNYEHQVRDKINRERIFACTWSQMKELAEAVVKNNPHAIQQIMVINVFKGETL